jgi:hypothetical protein
VKKNKKVLVGIAIVIIEQYENGNFEIRASPAPYTD